MKFNGFILWVLNALNIYYISRYNVRIVHVCRLWEKNLLFIHLAYCESMVIILVIKNKIFTLYKNVSLYIILYFANVIYTYNILL